MMLQMILHKIFEQSTCKSIMICRQKGIAEVQNTILGMRIYVIALKEIKVIGHVYFPVLCQKNAQSIFKNLAVFHLKMKTLLIYLSILKGDSFEQFGRRFFLF